jgi:DNA repair photolyase
MRGVEVVERTPKTVLNAVKGMDFRWSINPYRGCYHQCTFCYARRTHQYLEEDGVARWGTRLYAKVNAPAVLRTELAKRSWRHEYVAIGTVTDPYQPLEGRYRLTRGILEALRDYETPAGIITRSPLVVRDADVLAQLAAVAGVSVSVSVATMDAALARDIEPTVAPPAQRLRAVSLLAAAGIEVHVALAPIIPQVTDSQDNIDAVIAAARDAGASRVWHNTLYLHEVTRDAFFSYLRKSKPELIATYAQNYRGTYAPAAVHDRIDVRVKRALVAHPLGERFETIRPSGSLQLSLI